jgi:hypothetical protein
MGKQKAFDLTTHKRDLRTGEVIEVVPYRLFDSKLHGEIFERPVGSGICYFRDGSRAPTIAEVKKANEALEAAKPKPLTTADISQLKEDFKNEYRDEVEKDIKAKAEEEYNARLDDLVAARVTQVMENLGVTGEQAQAIKDQVAPVVSVTEPEKPAWIKDSNEQNVEGA